MPAAARRRLPARPGRPARPASSSTWTPRRPRLGTAPGTPATPPPAARHRPGLPPGRRARRRLRRRHRPDRHRPRRPRPARHTRRPQLVPPRPTLGRTDPPAAPVRRHRDSPAHAGRPGPGRRPASSSSPTPSPCSPDPAACAAWLRTGTLPGPAASISLPLDVGAVTETHPPAPAPRHHRPRPALRRPRLRPATPACHVHHIIPRSHGGTTSLANCLLLCSFHHLILIHRWGWTISLNPDGTTTPPAPADATYRATARPLPPSAAGRLAYGREHPRETLGQAAVTFYDQAAVSHGVGDRLAAEGNRAKRRHGRVESDRGTAERPRAMPMVPPDTVTRNHSPSMSSANVASAAAAGSKTVLSARIRALVLSSL